jgi:homopolymeric O-antigen transport system ATP-binding protein
MSELAIEFDGVWKKFKKGEIHDSLRDLIPALTRVAFSRNGPGELHEREFWALRDISFQIRRGEAWGIVGANGAGKSTILKLLSKILRANKGAVNIHGKVSALIEVGAGFHPDLTGRENVYLNGCILGMKRQEVARKFDQIVEFAGVGDFIDTPVKRYSSGMYARLGFAVAAHVDPDILLVDEVLSVGDMQFQEKCLDRMREVVEEGTTVIFVSHNLQAVQTLCEQTLLLKTGTVSTIGPTAKVLNGYLCEPSAGASSFPTLIEDISLHDLDGLPKADFSPGEKAQLHGPPE